MRHISRILHVYLGLQLADRAPTTWPTAHPAPEMEMGQWVMGHGSNGSLFLDWSHGSWVTACDLLTHDEITATACNLKYTKNTVIRLAVHARHSCYCYARKRNSGLTCIARGLTKSLAVARKANRFWDTVTYIETFHWKLRPNRYRWKRGYYWQPISRHRLILRYQRQLLATYRSATIPHDWHSKVPNDLSKSSKVNDFCVVWKGLCNFLLAIKCNLGFIFHRFWDMASFRLKNAHFSYPPPFSLKFKHVSLKLNHWNYAHE